MDTSSGIKASLQGRYASALYELASESGATAVVESDLAKLGEAIAASGDLAALIRSPQVGRQSAGKAVASVGALLKLSPITQKFLGVVASNGRLASLPEVIRAFSAIAAASRGEVTADVTSARPLDDSQLKALAKRLEAREGRSVAINTVVDPDILGGLVVRIGSQQIDSSIRTRLNSLAQAMKG